MSTIQVILNPKLKDMKPKCITGICHHYYVQSQKAQNNVNMLYLFINKPVPAWSYL